MLALPGVWGAGRRGLHLEDDGRREDLQGAGAGAGPMPGIQEGAKGSLVMHCQTQHRVSKGGLVSEGGMADEGDDPRN